MRLALAMNPVLRGGEACAWLVKGSGACYTIAMADDDEQSPLIDWHHLFGEVLEQVLGPLDIVVQTDVDVSNKPPEIDVLLMRNKAIAPTWTPAQRALLPDGIRERRANHIIIEFKYTESVNQDAVQSLLGYEVFYRRSRSLKTEEVHAVLASGHTPRQTTREILGYTQPEAPGIYRNTIGLLARTSLMVLSELEDTPHNVLFKLFAQRRRARAVALARFEREMWKKVPSETCWLVHGLKKLWSEKTEKGESTMHVITKEDLIRQGKEMYQQLFRPLIADGVFDDILESTPYMQRRWEEARREGLEQGRQQGLEQGRTAGVGA
ncbi:MAG: hypothetical protein HC884_17770, partial [Chloroflexaceae bacterium]|nr:hypothetical protein [Chloroflexaceae bacterium]